MVRLAARGGIGLLKLSVSGKSTSIDERRGGGCVDITLGERVVVAILPPSLSLFLLFPKGPAPPTDPFLATRASMLDLPLR